MQEEFLKFIQDQNLVSPDEKVLLTVSGGIDSMVMAHLFVSSGFTPGIAHVNYGLRGADSNQDEELVRAFCTRHGLVFHLRDVRSDEFKGSESVQMVARRIRYQFFDDLTAEHGYGKVATAHHLDDSLETILLNLAKGTGIKGLAGISVSNGTLIRPMMFTGRDRIKKFAEDQGISWREDISNQKDIYQRNLIRNRVMAVLREINPNLTQTYGDTKVRLDGAARLIDQRKEQVLRDFSTKTKTVIRLKVNWVGADPDSLVILAEILIPYSFNYSQVKQILNSILEKNVGATYESPQYQLTIDRSQLFLNERIITGELDSVFIHHELDQVSYHGNVLRFESIGENPGSYSKKQNIALLDKEKISFPLELRKWKKGDKFTPLGMKGRKMVSDFMIDRKNSLIIEKGRSCFAQRGGNCMGGESPDF